MTELRGKAVADSIMEAAAKDVDMLKAKGVTPKLAVIRVGERPDDISYERGIIKRFGTAGVEYEVCELKQDCTQEELDSCFDRVNNDDKVHGILMFRPLPKHLSDEHIKRTFDPDKDIDGMGYFNQAALYAGKKSAFAPCTAQAVLEMLRFYNIPTAGKRVTVVGRSLVIGRPIALLLISADATVTVCHRKTADIVSELKKADIIVAAAGEPKMITSDMIGDGQIIIDVGMNVDEEGRLCGDVDYENAAPKADVITPVPGGVGAVTTSVLLRSTIEGALRTVNGEV